MAKSEIRIGMSLSNRALIFMPDVYSLDNLLEFARYLDDSKYDSIWFGDGFLDRPRWDPIVLHSAIAMTTKRVRLGTATLNIDYRRPLQFARDWATMDQISRGRSVLGIGLGASTGSVPIQREMEVAGNGHLYHIRGTMMKEWVELVKELWTKDKVSYHGKCFNFDDVWCEPKPYQKPHPPVLMAAGYPTAKDFVLKRLAKVADGWLVDGGTTPELYAPTWEKLKEYLKQNGRDPNKFETAYQVTGAIGGNVQEIREEMIWWIKAYYWRDDSHRLHWWGPVGGADAWIDWLTKCADAGVKTFIVRFATRRLKEQIDKFTKEVLPSF